MQYFRGIYSAHDVYADNDGSYQQVCNVNDMSDWSTYYNSPLVPLPTTHAYLNTEVIKQTIFGHEAVFRNQVLELHRLYNKQRELMNELRNDFNRENSQLRLASSGYGLIEQKQSTMLWLNPSQVSPSVTDIKPFQPDLGKSVHNDRGMCQVECTSQRCELLDAKCKKYNNKVLDLQLLATEYMDDEDYSFSAVAEATHSVRNTSPFSASGELVDQHPLGLDIQEKGPRTESASARPILFDLNEPFSYEEATPTMSSEEVLFEEFSRSPTQQVGCSSAGDTDKNVHQSVAKFHSCKNDDVVNLSYDREGQKLGDSNPLNQESKPNSFSISDDFPKLKPEGCDAHSVVENKLKRSSKKRSSKSRKPQGCLAISENNTLDNMVRVPKSLQLTAVMDKTETRPNKVLSPVQSMLDFRRNPIVVQALPCIHAPVLMKKKKPKLFLTASWPDGDKPRTKRGLLNPIVDPNRVKKSSKGKKGRRNRKVWNVNQDSYRLEPPSPDNEECSPPRGESDENLLETRRRFCAVEDGDSEADIARIAAKAIVFLSAADVNINRPIIEPSLLSPDNPLNWFAEVVSVESEKESMFLDDFETMTLKLEGTNTEEQYCRSIVTSHDEKHSLVTAVYGRATRARGKRTKKLKDFQGVVLPRLSSLSKCEVTEDLQLIEDLLETTGIPNIFGSRKRSGCFRGRKQSSNIDSVVAENSPSPYLPLDLRNKNSDSEYLTGERRPMMIDWGKITRRRRGQRYPARKLSFSHLSIAPTLKAH